MPVCICWSRCKDRGRARCSQERCWGRSRHGGRGGSPGDGRRGRSLGSHGRRRRGGRGGLEGGARVGSRSGGRGKAVASGVDQS